MLTIPRALAIAVAAICISALHTPSVILASAGPSSPPVQPHLSFDESSAPPPPDLVRGAPVTPLALSRRNSPAATADSQAVNSSSNLGGTEVLGFVQQGEVSSGSWQADLRFNLLSTVAYDSIDVNSDGSLVSNGAGYQVYWSSQATNLFNAAHAAGDRVVATFTDFSTSGINSLLTSATAENAFINNVVNQVASRGVDGVNVDFEPVGDSPDAQAFTALMSSLHSALISRAPTGDYLSVDTYASAYQGGEMYDIPHLANAVDAVDVMTYSMNGPTQPNSPMGGPYGYTDPSVVAGYLSEMSASKLLLGIPYFGEVYSTANNSFNAPVANASQTMSPVYSAILADFGCVYQPNGTQGPVINWDQTSETPWAYWYGPASNASCGSNYSTWRELYYDNAQSLERKYAFVLSQHLRGIGIWALGMDSGSSDLWNALAQSFVPLSPPPSGIIAVSRAPGQATISWTPPANAQSNRVSGYTLQTYDSNRAPVGSPAAISGAAASSYTVTGLSNGTPYYFSIAAVDPSGTGAAAQSNSVTPLSGNAPPAALSASSTQQYFLPNSDGSAWQPIDPSKLAFTITPTSAENVVLSADASLWTLNPGYNQDLGIEVTPAGGSPAVVAWKESGGSYAFAPNAASVHTVYAMGGGITYTVEAVWKTNRPAIGESIADGAAPSSPFSPTILTAAPLSGVQSAVSTQQYTLTGSDGVTWQPLDPAHLSVTVSPAQNGSALVEANADLWTASAGYNQDLAIFVSVNDGAPTVVAWKESGGSMTYSPTAASAQAVYPMVVGNRYVFSLWWKTNRAAPRATIFAGAGPISGQFSPTRITTYPISSQWPSSASNLQYALQGSDGTTWHELDPTNLTAAFTPGSSQTAIVSAGADMWTATPGLNQDLAIFVSVNGGSEQLVAWEESGGVATFSPNAALVKAAYPVTAGNTYVFSIWWKANRPVSGSTIYIGAGPLRGAYSPTRVTVSPQ